MKQLLPDQIPIVNDTIRSIGKGNSPIMQSPTGSGKSVMMLHIAHRASLAGYTSFVITESKKIFKQLANEFNAIRIDPSTKYIHIRQGGIYVAMARSLDNRQNIIDQFNALEKKIALNDEAHIGTATNLLKKLNCPIVGVTATPAWRWAKHLSELYNDFISGLQVEELISLNRLSPYRHLGRKKIDASGLKKDSNGEYTSHSQEIVFSDTKVFDGLLDDLKVIPYKVCMLYTASIKQADKVYKMLTDNGYNCAISHSKREDDQEQIHKFENNPKCSIMVSVASLTKGYDFPLIDLIVLYRATTSLPLLMQMIGRGGRVLYTDEQNKQYANRISGNTISEHLTKKTSFTCIDYGLNGERLGFWDQNRDWKKLSEPNNRKSELPAPVKTCPECDCMIHSSAMLCKWCGYKFPYIEKELEQGELVDFRSNYTKLIGKRISELTPKELAEYSKAKSAGHGAIRIAMAKRQRERIERERWKWNVKQYGELSNPYEKVNYLRDFCNSMRYKPAFVWKKTEEIKKLTKLIYYRDFILT